MTTDGALHKHCANCFSVYCKVRLSPPCDVIFCRLGCGAMLHSCKLDDHHNVCGNQRVACINEAYGCPDWMPRAQLGKHLERCPASVIYCTMEWNRWPVYSRERRSRVPFPQENIYAKYGQLDVALALRDQRMLSQAMRLPSRTRRALRNPLTLRFPAVPIANRYMRDEPAHAHSNSTSRTVSDDESDTPWGMAKHPPGLQSSVCKELFEASRMISDSLSAALNVVNEKLADIEEASSDPSDAETGDAIAQPITSQLHEFSDNTLDQPDDNPALSPMSLSLPNTDNVEGDTNSAASSQNEIGETNETDMLSIDKTSSQDGSHQEHEDVDLTASTDTLMVYKEWLLKAESGNVVNDAVAKETTTSAVAEISVGEIDTNLVTVPELPEVATETNVSKCDDNSCYDLYDAPSRFVIDYLNAGSILRKVDKGHGDGLDTIKKANECLDRSLEGEMDSGTSVGHSDVGNGSDVTRTEHVTCLESDVNKCDDINPGYSSADEYTGSETDTEESEPRVSENITNNFDLKPEGQYSFEDTLSDKTCQDYLATDLGDSADHSTVPVNIMDKTSQHTGAIEASNGLAVDRNTYSSDQRLLKETPEIVDESLTCNFPNDQSDNLRELCHYTNGSDQDGNPDREAVSDTVTTSIPDPPPATEAVSDSVTTSIPDPPPGTETVSDSVTTSIPDPPPAPSLILQQLLGLDLNIESITRYQAKPKSMYTFLCAQSYRRDEYPWHFKNVHDDIHSGLNGWLEQRCPLANLGCTYSQRRLRPKDIGSKVIYNSVLGCFGVKPGVTSSDRCDPNPDQDALKQYISKSRHKEMTPEIFTSRDFDSRVEINGQLKHDRCIRQNTPPIHDDYLSVLPVEVLQYLCMFLDGYSLSNLALTSKHLRHVCCSMLEQRGIVILEWEKVTIDSQPHWINTYRRWLFSCGFSPVRSWVFEDHPSVGQHLQTCEFNQPVHRTQPFPLPCLFPKLSDLRANGHQPHFEEIMQSMYPDFQLDLEQERQPVILNDM